MRTEILKLKNEIKEMNNLNSDNSSKMKFLQEKIENLNQEIIRVNEEINVKIMELKNEKDKNIKLNMKYLH